jgi:hypothetical protein
MTRTIETSETAVPLPRRAYALAVAAYALAALTLGWPALTGQFLVSPHSDQYIAGYAFREFAAASLREGNGFPLWNPYLAACRMWPPCTATSSIRRSCCG